MMFYDTNQVCVTKPYVSISVKCSISQVLPCLKFVERVQAGQKYLKMAVLANFAH